MYTCRDVTFDECKFTVCRGMMIDRLHENDMSIDIPIMDAIADGDGKQQNDHSEQQHDHDEQQDDHGEHKAEHDDQKSIDVEVTSPQMDSEVKISADIEQKHEDQSDMQESKRESVIANDSVNVHPSSNTNVSGR